MDSRIGLIPRNEFHRRYMRSFNTAREAREERPVGQLLAEIERDAPYRGHSYLFNGSDIAEVKIDDVADIMKVHPGLQNEHERLEAVMQELVAGTYEPVPLSVDQDNRSIIFVENGFHRIYGAWLLGWKTISCSVRYGRFRLDKNITFGELAELLEFVDRAFAPYGNNARLRRFLQAAIEADPSMAWSYSLGYGKGDE